MEWIIILYLLSTRCDKQEKAAEPAPREVVPARPLTEAEAMQMQKMRFFTQSIMLMSLIAWAISMIYFIR